jgi:hypothetical protein
MHAILDTLIDALRLMTFQPPMRQTHHTRTGEMEGAGLRCCTE